MRIDSVAGFTALVRSSMLRNPACVYVGSRLFAAIITEIERQHREGEVSGELGEEPEEFTVLKIPFRHDPRLRQFDVQFAYEPQLTAKARGGFDESARTKG